MKLHQQYESIREIKETTTQTQAEEETSKTVQGKETVKLRAAGPSETTPVLYSGVVPSATSSPSHEFSFTLPSVSHSAAQTAATSPTPANANLHHCRPLAIDLSPADDIFFHGHLLPLHFLSHFPVSSPRSSTNSLDSFTALPVREASQEEKPTNNYCSDQDQNNGGCTTFCTTETHSKPKPFSLFGLPKWKKGSETKGTNEKKKAKFDVGEFVKRYVKMVKPLLSPKAGRRDSYGVPRQSYSFTGNLTPNEHKRSEVRGLRAQFSAPASMVTSTTNSGRILSTAAGVPSSSTVSDSTMEELQAAIQAAIAHCKDSISGQEKKTPEILPVPVN